MSDLAVLPPDTGEEAATDFLSRPFIAAIHLDWEKTIYLAFIVIAIITRFYGLGDRVVSHDESLHTQYSYQYYNGDGYIHSPLMHGPTLFHATAVSYWLFGDSDFASRVPNAILGLILIILPYFLRDWLGRSGALFTSFLFLISPYISYYSRYIRHDIYLIVFAVIVFIATWYFIREQRNRYLWWFTAALALMFTTMEASFIYVAIFGSFLVVRLLALVLGTSWLRSTLPNLRVALLVALIGVILVGAGFGAHTLLTEEATATTPTVTSDEGFAVDPNAPTTTMSPIQTTGNRVSQWVELLGIGLFSLGIFLVLRGMRPHIDAYGEFHLIILYATLLLPMTSPLLMRIAGWNPQDYTLNTCVLAGQETMSGLQILLARMFNFGCWSAYLQSGAVKSGIFVGITFVISAAVGLWWDRRRWIVAAVIFYGIALLLFTSFFTNIPGWRTGIIGSLGYWLEQHGVQRGSQPWFYYLFVTPFYEFLPLVFALAGMVLWTRQRRINGIVWYWVLLGLGALVAYSLANWYFNRDRLDPTQQSAVPGMLLSAVIIATGAIYWFLFRRKRIAEQMGLQTGLRELVDLPAFVGFVPSLIWWMLLTWPAYSIAGEKMPWLSTHLVVPMAFLAGWYLGQKVTSVATGHLLNRRTALAVGLTMLLIVVALLALAPILLGKISLGDQTQENLKGVGRFLGGLLVVGGLAYMWRRTYSELSAAVKSVVVVLAVFGLLSLLTIRFSYMANYVNYDYTNEFMVYAHGAPATKSVVLNQLEELSMRLHGDLSIKVAYDSDVSWPYTWYLRNYPNRVFFGDNATQSLNDSPVVIVGRKNWEKVDPYLSNNYTKREYTFLWWPMEEYRRFSWNAIFGNPRDEVRRGLANPNVRQALWDIFFYRDYTKYGEVFGGTYTAGQWPLRHDLRLYIRKDVLADIWDQGLSALTAAPLADPYEGNALVLSPELVLNESGLAGSEPGAFSSARNVAVGPDGNLYVADSGNNRIQVFDGDGRFLRQWGSGGTDPGQFNEPWGLAVDDQYVYVADTWNHRIQKFTHDGELVGAFGISGSVSPDDPSGGLGLFFGPRDIVVLPDGRLLITDTGNHRLQVMTPEGEFVQQVGSFGNQPGQFNEPVGLAVAPDGSIYVADTWNGRVQRFSSDFVSIGEWRVDAWYGQSINNKPYLDVDGDGRIYVTDPEGYRVLIFSPSGAYLNRFGQFGTDPSSLGLPNGIALAPNGAVIVADAGNHRVLRFPPIYEPATSGAAEDDGSTGEDGELLAEPSDQVDDVVQPSPTPFE